MNKCKGCGITIQNIDKTLPGYVTDLKYEYCERCFRNINYSEITNEDVKYSNDEIINQINQNADLVFFITDLLNLNKEIIELYHKITKSKYFVINKLDIIPDNISFSKIDNLLKEEYQIKEKIIYTSNKNNNLSNLITGYQNIYFCGLTNSGKSSLIAHLTNNNEIIQSYMLNSTLDFNLTKYENLKIYDAPGFIITTNLENTKMLKNILATTKLKPRSYVIKEYVKINIHDLFSISFDSPNKVIFYFSNGLVIKKGYGKHDNFQKIEIPKDSDLIILGYGFINVKEKCICYLDENIKWEIRKSIFK